MEKAHTSRRRALREAALQSKALMDAFTLDDLHTHRVDRHTFTIFVGGDPAWDGVESEGEPGVDYRMADRFDVNLSLLSSISKTRPILVHMASCGGLWEEGMQMFGAILACPNPVTVLGTRHCRSMSSIIPLAADRFVMRSPTSYMYHAGTWAFEGLEAEADTADLYRRKSNEMMIRIYTARLREQGRFSKPHFTDADIRQALTSRMQKEIDVWLSGDEAVQWGFCDAVWEGDPAVLRAKSKNVERRKRMLEVLRRPIKVEVKVS